ncbi:SusD/RagB family nutrient-binding outer membrane lipoprotein [Chitinophaga rhizophila]|uniref:SusD/RagB family nutrient-binding outer membrane lipoprotein n=1 Tax=Chitinophaga rhizophila TaxID=2866212 RepID=A0ABS7G9S8_9BACT|nr:SusD/RagB family nutrient-binding outer membrane lipoprotein [Chitinophaga rhizophila]MBW8684045.1 SusD/RagB family nutrient-binding outer membrane lipoprotein [Chitinophaga rhizophila]
MKKVFVNIALFCSLAGLFSSCAKKMEESFNNPEKISEGSLSKLLTGMFLNKRIHPTYHDYFTFIMPLTANYSQLVAAPSGNQMYIVNPAYIDVRWTDFYAGSRADDGQNPDYNYNGPGILSNYREMQTTLGLLPADQQARNQVFLKCAEVVLYDQASQMIDLWGDIPFYQAGNLNTPDRVTKDAPFDDAKGLYNEFITKLKDINTYLDTVNVEVDVKSELTTADILLRGDLVAWQRYANSLRLRLLMRISNTDAAAQAEVTTMLANEATYPLVSNNAQNVLFKESPTAIRSDLVDPFTNYYFGPEYLINTLQETNEDPRIHVMWDENEFNGYNGFPWNGTAGQWEATQRQYSAFDTATFTYNDNIPGVIVTASEVSLLKAEAYERWGLGDAATQYTNGLRQSIEFYYGINQSAIKRQGQNNFNRAPLASPTAEAINNFLGKPAIAYTGSTTEKLAKIYTQKWAHFFVLQAGQAWAELRRTGYPVLQFPNVANSMAPNPPKRLVYPTSEQMYNATEYSKVVEKDKRDRPIFWDAQ